MVALATLGRATQGSHAELLAQGGKYAELYDQMIQHARTEAPNECCGLVAAQDGIAVGVHPASNAASSPLRFEIDPKELLGLSNDIEERGWEFGAIYHSHVRSTPYPSQTDINFAANWPGVEWIIVGLAEGSTPEVRSYLIEGGEVREVPITRVPA